MKTEKNNLEMVTFSEVREGVFQVGKHELMTSDILMLTADIIAQSDVRNAKSPVRIFVENVQNAHRVTFPVKDPSPQSQKIRNDEVLIFKAINEYLYQIDDYAFVVPHLLKVVDTIVKTRKNSHAVNRFLVHILTLHIEQVNAGCYGQKVLYASKAPEYILPSSI